MSPQLLLQLLNARPRNARARGNTMVAGLLVIASLLVGTLGLVALVNGSKLGAFFSGEARDAQQVAEAGADQIIATFNQPENRQLLVAGSTPPSQWSTSNPALQSPCVASDGTRPGSNNGLPTQRAVDFRDGQFRDPQNAGTIVDADSPGQTKRSFRLVSVRYSAGERGRTNRRSIYRTFQANGSADGEVLSQAGDISAGTSFNSLVNLYNQDGGEAQNGQPALIAGINSGLITLTVEGRFYGADGSFTTSTTTKEFEVLPKCCGGSFGSNDSGGVTYGNSPPNSLGADSRNCGLDFGLIVGLNLGRLYSYTANDRFTRTNQSGQVESIDSILGLISQPAHKWNRKISDKNPAPWGGDTEMGCRTLPSNCSKNDTNHPLWDNASLGFPSQNREYGVFNTKSGGGGNGLPTNCTQRDALGTDIHPYGDRASNFGVSASCVNIRPLFLQSPGLPSIQTNFTYPWTSGQNTNTVSGQLVWSDIEGGYPIIKAELDDTANIWLRANGSTNQITPGPFLEYCNTKYLPSNACASVFNGASIHSWAVISQSGDVSGGIGDDFGSNSLSGRTANSTPRWPSIWEMNDTSNTMGQDLTTGDLQIKDGQVTFQDVGSDFGTNYPSAPAIARAVNLYALRTPVLEFTFTRTGLGTFDTLSALELAISSDNSNLEGNTTNAAINAATGWQPIATVRADGSVALSNQAPSGNCQLSSTTYTCRIAFPPKAYANSNRFRHYVKFRLRANSNYGTGTNSITTVVVDNIAIKSSTANPAAEAAYLNWCERSPASHIAGVGFHCLGPTINLFGASNNLYIDTSDYPISFYYTSSNDYRGHSITTPLIWLKAGALIRHVSCSRGNNMATTAPQENCKLPVDASAFNSVGTYGRLNFFGRNTPLGYISIEAGMKDQPTMQVINIDNYAYSGLRSGIFGAWLYFPWGHLAFCGVTCAWPWGGSPLSVADLHSDNSFNFYGRLWVRSLSSAGQTHLRIVASPSENLTNLAGGNQWTGVDWVARATTRTRI